MIQSWTEIETERMIQSLTEREIKRQRERERERDRV